MTDTFKIDDIQMSHDQRQSERRKGWIVRMVSKFRKWLRTA